MNSRIILLLVLLIILPGCDSLFLFPSLESSPYGEVDIEVLRPADTTLRLSSKNLLVFAKPNLIPQVVVNVDHKNLKGKIKFERITSIEFHAMADLLSESPQYNLLIPIDTPVAPDGDSYSWDEIDTICKKAGADACLILSGQEIQFVILPGLMKFKNIELLSDYKLYIPSAKKVLYKRIKTAIDLQLENDEDIDTYLYQQGPDSLISDFARQNGEKFVYWLAPVWQRDTRNYYLSGNKEMESVPELIKAEKWEDVYSIWRKNKDNRNAVTAMHASYNCILSYELEGKIDSAMIMARMAYKRFGTEEIVDYGLILEERMRQNELVNIQLGAR